MFLSAFNTRFRIRPRGLRKPPPASHPVAIPEAVETFRRVADEIRAIYTNILLRQPTPEDITYELERFCNRLPTPEQRQQVVRDGRIRVYLDIRPLSVEIDLSNQCNLRCVMCHFHDEQVYRRRRQDLPVEEFARIAEQVFPLCHLLNLSFGTEPFLHHHFCELLEITKRYEVPGVYAVTNGLLLDERLSEQLLRADCLNSLTISIDAATAPTYERIRVGGHFNRLLTNIRTLNRLKEQRGTTQPVLDFNFVLMRSNIAELPAVVRLAHDLQVRAVTAVHMVPFGFSTGNTRDESLFDHPALCNRILDEARSVADELGVALDVPKRFAGTPDTSIEQLNNESVFRLHVLEEDVSQSGCYFPWYWVGIDPYGRVNPCGWWYGEEPMGDLRTQTFEEIWNSEPYQKLRSEHRSCTVRPTCQACPASGLGNVNNPSAFLVRKPTGPAFLGEP